MKTKVIFLWIVLAFLFPFPAFAGGWLIYHDGPYMGKVVDADTGVPLAGTAVVAIWNLERFGGAGGGIAKFFEAKETLTNEKGEFNISSITGFHWWPFSTLDKPVLKVFRRGYSSYEAFNYEMHETGAIKLKIAESKNERIKALLSINICGEISDDICIPRKKVSNMMSIVDREAKDLGLLK